MKSTQMITALAADSAGRVTPAKAILIAVVLGSLGAAALFAWHLGLRLDVWEAMRHADFVFKFAVTLSVAVPGVACLLIALRPGRDVPVASLALGPAVLVVGVLIELVTAPIEGWSARMLGSNAMLCLISIPLLALAPFACLLLAARNGAPTRPRLAGALCGLAASSIGATLYAAHCTDDSPLFVAVWYSMAIVATTLAGSLIGARWLRW